MERRNSYSRPFLRPTTASRVAEVRNMRESLLLAKASQGFATETDITLKNIFRERAKAIAYLQQLYERRYGLLNAKSDGFKIQSNAETNSFQSRSEEKGEVKAPRVRRVSLDVNKTDETKKRIQEFLTRELPGQSGQSKDTQREKSKVENAGNVFGEEGFNLDALFDTKGSESHGKEKVTSKAPFRVRSRVSGICLSHCHSHLPSANNMAKMQRKFSEPLFPVRSPCILRESPHRNLSSPLVVSQISQRLTKLDNVTNSHRPLTAREKTSTDKIVVKRRCLTPMPTEKHSFWFDSGTRKFCQACLDMFCTENKYLGFLWRDSDSGRRISFLGWF